MNRLDKFDQYLRTIIRGNIDFYDHNDFLDRKYSYTRDFLTSESFSYRFFLEFKTSKITRELGDIEIHADGDLVRIMLYRKKLTPWQILTENKGRIGNLENGDIWEMKLCTNRPGYEIWTRSQEGLVDVFYVLEDVRNTCRDAIERFLEESESDFILDVLRKFITSMKAAGLEDFLRIGINGVYANVDPGRITKGEQPRLIAGCREDEDLNKLCQLRFVNFMEVSHEELREIVKDPDDLIFISHWRNPKIPASEIPKIMGNRHNNPFNHACKLRKKYSEKVVPLRNPGRH